MKISLLIATRKRPDMLENMWRSAHENRAFGFEIGSYKHELELVLYVDEDDVVTQDLYYNRLITSNTIITIGKRLDIIGEAINICFRESSGDICMLCTDDVIFHTNGWDDLVVNEFLKYPDRILMVYGEDGIQHGHTATLPFLHRNWIDTIGRFLPMHFVNEFGDRWITHVAKAINRCIYLPNLYIQHLHPAKKTMLADETYLERRKMSRDKMPLNSWRKLYDSLLNERNTEANKLQKFIDNFKD